MKSPPETHNMFVKSIGDAATLNLSNGDIIGNGYASVLSNRPWDTAEADIGLIKVSSKAKVFPVNIRAEAFMRCNGTAYDKTFGFVDIRITKETRTLGNSAEVDLMIGESSASFGRKFGPFGVSASGEYNVYPTRINVMFSNGQRLVGAKFNVSVRMMGDNGKLILERLFCSTIGMAGFHGAVERTQFLELDLYEKDIEILDRVEYDFYLTNMEQVNGSAGGTCDR